MKSKRALELEEAEARVTRLRSEVAVENARAFDYLKKELQYHLMHLFKQIAWVRYENEVVCVAFSNSFLLRVAVPNGWNKEKTQLLLGDTPFITIYENTCDVLNAFKVPGYYVRLLGEVLPDALRIAQEVIPAWRANPPNVQLLMTTRVLYWIAKQLPGMWPDIIIGHVVDKFE